MRKKEEQERGDGGSIGIGERREGTDLKAFQRCCMVGFRERGRGYIKKVSISSPGGREGEQIGTGSDVQLLLGEN